MKITATLFVLSVSFVLAMAYREQAVMGPPIAYPKTALTEGDKMAVASPKAYPRSREAVLTKLEDGKITAGTVSYTHLTLPTIYSV